MSDTEEHQEEITDLSSPDVVTKYRLAGDIANEALKAVLEGCVVGASVVELCQLGDKIIEEGTAKVFNKGKKKVEKGIAFPTCVSVNHIVGHYSPMKDCEDKLADGDVVKVDLGCHVDGFVAVAAHTKILANEVEGNKANVLAAAYNALEAAVRLVKPGRKNTEVTDAITKCAESFKCEPIEHIASHELNKFEIDGERAIVSKNDPRGERQDEFEFQPNEVYAMDIVMSTGTGHVVQRDAKCTVFRRDVNKTYSLKMKAARSVFSEINNRFPVFAFTMRALEQKSANFGLTEMEKHQLVSRYPVLYEKEGEFVVHLKSTLLLMPSGTIQITGVPVDMSTVKPEHEVTDEELKKVLASSKGKKRRKKKKSAAKK